MNRKERRSVEKKLKLTEFYSKQSLSKKLARISDNINRGKTKHEEFTNSVNVSLQSQRDEKESSMIESKAAYIAKTKSIPYIDALDEARK